ncbi:MAG: hypothetical protein KDK34_24850 [Leptospiraceae bacterium]|nr:hypothetical protein [Leptospiraceae bacterium]MCB1323511.1 hypothetical protein [Leptospiraceae bacterium]
MIPPNVLKLLRLAAILVWVIAGGIVAIYSWQSGAESAPQMGQDLSLANIKEKVEREENLRRTGDVILPDLNDLISERHRDDSLARELAETPMRRDMRDVSPGLAGEDVNLLEPDAPVRDRTPGALPLHGDDTRVIRGSEFLPGGESIRSTDQNSNYRGTDSENRSGNRNNSLRDERAEPSQNDSDRTHVSDGSNDSMPESGSSSARSQTGQSDSERDPTPDADTQYRDLRLLD